MPLPSRNVTVSRFSLLTTDDKTLFLCDPSRVASATLGAMSTPSSSVAALTRIASVVLVWIESAALAAGAVTYAVHGVAGTDDPGLTWALVAMLVVLAVPLALAARSLARGRRWARSYSLMWQVLQVAVGWYLVSSSPALGAAVIVVAVVAGAAVIVDTRNDPQI